MKEIHQHTFIVKECYLQHFNLREDIEIRLQFQYNGAPGFLSRIDMIDTAYYDRLSTNPCSIGSV